MHHLRLIVLLFALALAPALTSVPAAAATPAECSAYIGAFAKDLETNTTVVDDYARPNDPSPDHVAQSAARYNRDAGYSEECPSKKLYADALLSAWKAWLEHATMHANPIDSAQLAAEKLEKCTVTYGGTDAATCAKWKAQVAKWQDEWGRE